MSERPNEGARPSINMSGMGGVGYAADSSPVFSEAIGTSFLALLAIMLLFALLRAQKRNRKLMEEMMETQAGCEAVQEDDNG
ncbi:MAG: hypothetical protein JXB47_00420 [Anaerolineae bacterium]|nr:hypothetical protein [Anaerolineae bacterium]